jgi:Carboxypeptidase regulatory-like domain
MTKFLSLLLIAASLMAQTLPVTAGSVSGRVVDADTLQPIPGAKVGSRSLGWTLTDADGRYTIRNVAPGTAVIGMDYASGANLDDIPVLPRSVAVIGGREATGVDFKVWLDASISGHVFDENNEPLAGIRVTLFYQDYRADISRTIFNNSDELMNHTTASQTMLTDDRGSFSAKSSYVRAGKPYWLLAERERAYNDPMSDAPSKVESRKKVLSPTYYPNATSTTNATPIILHSMEHRDNLDIHMSSGPSYCIDATLLASGKPARIHYALEEEATSARHSAAGIPRKGGESGDDGKIRVCDLHSGQYQLSAYGKGLPGLVDFFGTTNLTISNRDLHDVIVRAEPPVKLAVELEWDKTPTSGSMPASLHVNSIPSFSAGLIADRTVVPGEVSLTLLPSLRQSLQVVWLVPPFFVKDMTVDGKSVLHQSFDPGTSDRKLHLIVSRDSGSIEAQASGFGTAVMIIPESVRSDAELAHMLVEGTTDDNGRFLAAQVPPGKYYVLATNSPPPNRIGYPAILFIDRTPENLHYLLRVRSQGQLVEVLSGRTTTVKVVAKDLQ